MLHRDQAQALMDEVKRHMGEHQEEEEGVDTLAVRLGGLFVKGDGTKASTWCWLLASAAT